MRKIIQMFIVSTVFTQFSVYFISNEYVIIIFGNDITKGNMLLEYYVRRIKCQENKMSGE